MDFFTQAFDVLLTQEPDEKIERLRALNAIRPPIDSKLHSADVSPVPIPGRPSTPQLVMPRELPKRSLGTVEGRAALVHAVTHIEFNAINLAVDAVYRFRQQPAEYYDDWMRVALDEARHFEMLRQRLQALGYQYGDFPAHNGLWEMAVDTAHDVLIRMALVPRVLEARGLDVTPGMIKKLQGAGDHDTVALLEIILAEEVPHVAIGTYWFNHHCHLRGFEPTKTFATLLSHYMAGGIRGPFNWPARREAGFTESDIEMLKQQSKL